MLDENSPLSLYYQLKNIIIDNIKNKIWDINTKIPTERELCENYKVSRITVRQALKELENEGYLYRKQGKGTFVTGQKFVQRLSHFYSFSEEISKMGSIPSTEILSFEIVPADLSIAEKLNIAEKEKVFSIRRLRLADNEPFAVETSYVVHKYAKDLTREDIDKYGLYKTLQQDCGIYPTTASETFEAVVTNSEEARFLQVDKRSAVLRLERITSSADGIIIEYCISIIRSDKYKYTIQLSKNAPVA